MMNTDKNTNNDADIQDENLNEEIAIDLAEEIAIDLNDKPHELEDDSLNGATVLVVDDDTFLLEMYAKKFKNVGFKILTTRDGEETLAKLKEGSKPDIVLFDLIMPQMDGLELISIINQENLIPEATKIVLSNQGQQSDVEKAEKLGIDGYIVKAMYTPSEIVEKVIQIHKGKDNKNQ